jgi:hypothetical protein
MHNRSYSIEKLGDTVGTLATGKGRIKERLADSFAHSFALVDPYAFPDELKTMILEVKKDLTSISPVGDEGHVRATLNRMDEDRAVQIANIILGIYYSVLR